MDKIYIWQLSDKELNAELELCLGLAGCHKNRLSEMETSEWDKIIRAIKKYQAKMHIEDFRHAFDDYAFGELECDKFKPTGPAGIGFLLRAYKDKKYGNTPKQAYVSPDKPAPAIDKDYYETLICIMEGKRSERHKKAFPHISDYDHLEGFRRSGQLIPMDYHWEAVYRHLRVLSLCDEVNGYQEQKNQVMQWISVKYPKAKKQSNMFPASQPYGTSLGQKVKQTLLV